MVESGRVPRRAGCRSALLGAGFLLAALVVALGPAALPASASCPQATSPSWTDACGPSFVLPGWGDGGGWTDPEQYATIQLADVDGDGADELLGRTPTGLAVQVFDKSFGQWRPQVDNQDRPIVLTAFANPPPLTSANSSRPATDWRLPQYYDTIQAADLDGQKGDEILARGANGIVVFKFTPSGTPGKGSWAQLSQSGPLAGSAWDAPYYYATIQTGDVNGDSKAELVARGSAGITTLGWNGSSWTTLPAPGPGILTDGQGFQDPRYYTSIQLGDVVGDQSEELIGRSSQGVSLYSYEPSGWSQLSSTHPFSDQSEQSDCPMAAKTTNCLGSGPAYYSTLQLADIDGSGQADLVARASDGVSAYFFDSTNNPGVFRPGIGRLSDLSDAKGADKEPYYSTLQFADVNKDGAEEALARDKDGLKVWSFVDGAKWTQLSPNPALTLADDPWGDTSTVAAGDRSRSYYSTIQTGDVDGDQRADVVARGPYGIRTWFYNRRGSGGWERYLDDGYTAFTGNQENAYTRLTSLARSLGYLTESQQTLRDVWTGKTEPTVDLQKMMSDLATAAGCPPSQDRLPHYQSCTPPSNPSGFDGTDWTNVINEIVTELYYANQVQAHFNSSVNGIRTVWKSLLVDQLAELPAIADDLKLQALKDTTADYDSKELFSGSLGIGGVLLNLVPGGEPVAAVFEVASEVISMVPSGSPSLTEQFDSTFSQLETQFATGVSQAGNTINAHSQLIRQDEQLLELVGQLRDRGTWQLDPAGMESAGQQGFALWVYKTLLPTLYSRYGISGCGGLGCTGPAAGTPGVVGSPPANFNAVGPSPTKGGLGADATPCFSDPEGGGFVCNFVALPSSFGTTVWGAQSAQCTYDGKTAGVAWTFGCNLGVDPANSIVASPIATREWNFATYTGNPAVWAESASSLTGSAVRVGQGRSLLRLRGVLPVRSSFRLGRARVAVHRLLHETGGQGELARGRRWPPLVLAPMSGGRRGAKAFSSQAGAKPRVRLRLRRRSRTSVAFDLRARMRSTSLPDACSGVRRGVDLATGPVFLHTRLRIRDGSGRVLPVSLRPHWRCRRDRLGAVHRLVVRQPEARTPSRGGLALALRGPRRAKAGGTATYVIRVRNRRRTAAYDVLVHGFTARGLRASRARGAAGGPRSRVWRLARLRPGRSRTLRLRVRVARSAAGTQRVVAVAQAIDTRHVSDRLSTRIRP